MTAARISPAASLLRNSKLFALPPAIALPVPDPSSEPVPRSDTATTLYPTKAAIETPLTSLNRGDWGFKRPLPLKSTTKSGSPSVRLNRGIDTAEHIADFDSAADHVLTLKKFQELNQPIQYPRDEASFNSRIHNNAFRKGWDNTTNLSASSALHRQYTGVWPSISPADLRKDLPDTLKTPFQDAADSEATSTPSPPSRARSLLEMKRWRYDGPTLVQMSGLEFDQWLKTLDHNKRQSFREFVRQDLLTKKRNQHLARARDEGTVGEVDPTTLKISDEELAEQLRRLRQQPRAFGTLIAGFLDLPEGPRASIRGSNEYWASDRNTLATQSYGENGPPRTHPSAGLSYIHTNRWARNHVLFGPQMDPLPVVARQVKTRVGKGGSNVTNLGLAGFIVEKENHKGLARDHNIPPYEPQPGGQKMAVKPGAAEIDEKGALRWAVRPDAEYVVNGERAVHLSLARNRKVASLRTGGSAGPRVMPTLTRDGLSDLSYKKRDDLTSESSDADFDFLSKTR